MKYKQEKITPNKAAIILKKNPKNRDIDGDHVTFLAKQMTAGEWEDNGQTIVISLTDNLVDGQHRLMAIVESGVTQMLLVVRGVEDKVIHSIDTGKSRSLNDVFKLEDHKYTNRKAAFTKALSQWKHKTLHQQTGFNHIKSSNDEYYNLFTKYQKKASEAVAIVNQKRALNFINSTDLSLVTFLLERTHKKPAVDRFLTFIIDGGDYPKSPSHFIVNFIQSRKRGIDLRYRKEDFYIVMHCFEEWLQGNEMEKINLPELMKNAPSFYPNYKVS